MGDFLFDQMKSLYPEATDEEVIQKIQATDAPAQLPVEAPVPVANPYKDMAIENVRQKYLGDKYGDAARQKIIDKNKEDDSGPNFRAALGALGAGFSGRDPSAAANDILKQDEAKRASTLSDFDSGKNAQLSELKTGQELVRFEKDRGLEAREKDVNSEESKLARDLAQRMIPKKDFSQLNAEQINKLLPSLTKVYDIEQKKLERQDALNEKKDARLEKRQDKLAAVADKKAEGITEGRKAVDRDFAKDYNDWTSGGQAAVDKNLKRLEEARNVLSQRKDDWFGTSGRLTGRLPDALRSQESVRLRQDVQAAAQGALKATLGSQFTEKEGERIMAAAYDEKLSPEENLKKIDAAIQELQTSKQNKNSKSRYFEQKGSLNGFSSMADQPSAEVNPNKPSWAK